MTIREAFEQSLADYVEVKVSFVDHPALVVPPEVRPAPHRMEIVSVGDGVMDTQRVHKTQTFGYGLCMAKPIEDLVIDDAGIHATLSFGGLGWHKTFVPWEAVLGLRCEGQRPKARSHN